MDAIQTIGLTKRYRNLTAVDSLNLRIAKGELFSLLGVNGAGKTTTIRMLTCLTKPSSGDAILNGHSILTEPAEVRKILGFSPQETAVAPNLTTKENLELMCGVHGFSRAQTRGQVEKLGAQFSLQEVFQKRAGKLSGGWQRRLSLAMALIAEPEILFLDEPTLGMDILARDALWEVIRGLKGKVTIVLTTHYMEEAEALSDRVGIMKDGRLLALGTVAELNETAGTDRLSDAFVAIVKGAAQ